MTGRWIAVLGVLLVASCAGLAPVPPLSPVQPAQQLAGHAWQQIHFSIHWPDGEDPRWYVDALIAHRVAAPALAAHRGEIELWRFHRRANRDDAGHALSLLSYAPARVNDALCGEIRSDELMQLLIQARMVDEIACTGPAQGDATRIDATSDPSWSPELQRTWPYFIMGVSQTWLGLIDEYARGAGPQEPARVHELLQSYREIEDRVSATWEEEGGHAFLHHLSAVFGYRPLYVPRRSLQSF